MLYSEIGGSGIVLSANYERQTGNKPGLGLHIGAGLGNHKPIIPFGVNYLFALKNKKSFIEGGAGIALAEEDIWETKSISYDDTPYKPAFIPSIGYRHHTEYGLMWRINYTPVFSRYRNIPLYAGISVGWQL